MKERLESRFKELTLLVAIFLVGYNLTKLLVDYNQPEVQRVVNGDFNHLITSQDIVLYTVKGCHACDKAKLFLELNAIKYEPREISNDKKWPDELSTLEIFSVPVLLTKDDLIIGFQQQQYEDKFL